MSCNDECAVEKAQAKEHAYFSGLGKGSELKSKRIREILENQRVRYGSVLINELIELLEVTK